jgi:Flp pilus assembly CpaF family ATPase
LVAGMITLLNVLADAIPARGRVVTIEDSMGRYTAPI